MEKTMRVIDGTVSRGNFSEPKTVTSKDGNDTWQSWSCYVDGKFCDTKQEFKGYVNSSYPIAVYDAKTQELYEDISSLDRATLKADVMVVQKGEKMYLFAINVKGLLQEALPDPFKQNPFVSLSLDTQQAPVKPVVNEKVAESIYDEDIPF